MALISCPECNSRVSDRAEVCPRCGFPLTTPQDLTSQFADHQWSVLSAGLAAESLEIIVSSDGSFQGVTMGFTAAAARWRLYGDLRIIAS